jgi:hypothetical protein
MPNPVGIDRVKQYSLATLSRPLSLAQISRDPACFPLLLTRLRATPEYLRGCCGKDRKEFTIGRTHLSERGTS